MKSFLILAPLAAALAGCSYYTTPAPVAVAPATYVVPPSAVVMGGPPAVNWGQLDSDGDGHANAVDRYPYDGTRY